MGLLGSAVRVGTRATRTTVRAGGSLARGRVPSLGIRLGVGGFGVGIGTRGISLGTPVLSQSIGLSGFQTTLRVPGLAQLSVNPVRPSATAGLGPLRMRISRNPGVGISTGLLSLGVAAKPLAWIDVLGMRVAVPGRLPTPSRPWHEEVDDQWRPYYERRPPAISEQLHDLIRDFEDQGRGVAFRNVLRPTKPLVSMAALAPRETRRHRREANRDALAGVSWRSRRERREARARATAAHAAWEDSERERREADRAKAQEIIDNAFGAWQEGDPLATALVVNAVLAASELPGLVVGAEEGRLSLVVLGIGINDVHPLGPAATPSGYPTVKKRTRAMRAAVYAELLGATTVSVLRAVQGNLHGVRVIEVAVTAPSTTGDLADAPTLAHFEFGASDPLPQSPHDLGDWMERALVSRARPLERVLPDAMTGSTADPAVAVAVTSAAQLDSAVFWTELGALLKELRRGSLASTAQRPSGERRKTSTGRRSRLQTGQDAGVGSEIVVEPDERTECDTDLLMALGDRLFDSRDGPSAGLLLDEAIAVLDGISVGDDAGWAVEYLAVAAVVTAAGGGDFESADRVVALAVQALGDGDEAAELRERVLEGRYRLQRDELDALAMRARGAVDGADIAGIEAVVEELSSLLPQLGDRSVSDVGEVVGHLAIGLVAAGRTDLVDLVHAAATQATPSVVRGLEPRLKRIRSLMRSAERILTHVADTPGCRQAPLGQEIDIDQEQVRLLCWYLAHFGRLRRAKAGNTYTLTLPQSSSA
jgi:hypothetical protein